MPEANHENTDLEGPSPDQKAVANRGPRMLLEKHFYKAEAHKDHDVHILENRVVHLHLVSFVVLLHRGHAYFLSHLTGRRMQTLVACFEFREKRITQYDDDLATDEHDVIQVTSTAARDLLRSFGTTSLLFLDVHLIFFLNRY